MTDMPKVLVIPGHMLLHPDRIGRGPAQCECGWHSAQSDTASKRREAHRFHKQDVWKKAMGT